MTLREFLDKQYGIRTDIIETNFTVGTSPVRIVNNNPNRISFTVSCLSGDTIFTSGNPSVSNSTGAYIGVGGSQTVGWMEDADTAGYELFAVSNSPGTKVYVREVVIINDIAKAA